MVDTKNSNFDELELPVHVVVKAARGAPPFLRFEGCCIAINGDRAVCLIDRFKTQYFNDLTTDFRYVEICPDASGGPLPRKLRGRITGLRYHRHELPLCKIAIKLESAPASLPYALQRYLKKIQRATQREASRPNLEVTPLGF
ncbi:hypothetical protein JXA32_05625 [Candidatus Sumerlaeota bacterium]|nr:hypothetical protein [Candidatus Sumerlaeota bacterium]